jgi:hypothetical protein
MLTFLWFKIFFMFLPLQRINIIIKIFEVRNLTKPLYTVFNLKADLLNSQSVHIENQNMKQI